MNETFNYYNQNAENFVEGTVNADMTPHYDAFLKYVPKSGHVLDAGCGSGRDSLAFMKMGYQVTAMDGSEALCQKASELIGKSVRHQYFEEIDEKNTYDGIWACATLLHVPSTDIQTVFTKMFDALKSGGAMYMSFKYGEFEGMRNGRYFTDYTEEKLLGLLATFPNVEVVEKWMTIDVRPDRDERWLNVVMRKKELNK